MNEHLTTDNLIDFLHGELPAQDDLRVHAHLATCSACCGEYEAEAKLGETLRAAAALEARDMPSLVSAAVWQRVREARPGPFSRMAAFLRPIVAVPVAAAIVLGAFFVSPLAHPNGRAEDRRDVLSASACRAGGRLAAFRALGRAVARDLDGGFGPESRLARCGAIGPSPH